MGLFVAAFWAAFAAATRDEDGSFCCSALSVVGLHERLVYPGFETFSSSLNRYFSQSARLEPQCFLQPHNAEEVALAVKTLVKANETAPCRFAVRSGGHTHFSGAAGISGGVTIDLSLMNDVLYHPDNETVSAGSGATWLDVYTYVDKIGKMVVGGRSASVGLGGMILGGGNSYHAARKGMVCDNVANMEVVLADGNIVNANKNENQDLFQVLKGGSNNFGIVTRFDLEAFEGGNIFGGLVLYPEETAEQQFQAILKFGDKIEEDPYGSAIVIGVYLPAVAPVPMFMNAYEYTSPVERPTVFEEFFSIPGNISDTTGIRNMTSLALELEEPKTHRISFSTLTFKSDIRVLHKAHAAFKTVVERLSAQASGDWAILTLYQPLPAIFAQYSGKKGGNILGLNRFNENLILYEPYLKWSSSADDHLFESQAQWLRDEIESFAKELGVDNEFVYLDYADKNQKPLESYGRENVAQMRKAAAKYDPEGVFQYMLPGGFKLSKVDPEFGKLDEGHTEL
ncbi:FAD-dependent monooxygenase CTB5 [Pseudocercospora fuligena]|uniref:FAD-dependent monooxygenase CTB5 n=1 Tax=Pseudocercospora fuligena TaxID=685502 RepID=A0A8H6RV07_9PEZI|nr:FAD-dependent monooxygenase CTB5 [Pseudocercospora fuligena]